MVVYLSCEYFNSKHFTHIIKNSIINFHLSDFTSKIFILFKNTTIFNRQFSVCFISLYKFGSTNSVAQIRQKIQHMTSWNCRNSSRLSWTIETLYPDWIASTGRV